MHMSYTWIMLITSIHNCYFYHNMYDHVLSIARISIHVIIVMDENVAIYRRNIVDISGVMPSRHDISKRQSIEGKIEKY